MKICSTCGEEKPCSEFYADTRRRDGLKSECKRCHCATAGATRDPEKHRRARRESMRRARAADPEKYRAREQAASAKRRGHPHVKARAALHAALRRGTMIRPKACERCGRDCVPHGHHHDYSKPLEVQWLCSECHGRQHQKHSEVPHV